MSSFLLWAQRQEISTSHTSESGVKADSHSLRDLGEDWIVCLGKVMLIRMNILHSILMNNEHLEKMVQKYSVCAKVEMFYILCTLSRMYDKCSVMLSFQPETHMENNHTAEADKNRVCVKRLCSEMHVHLNLSIRYQTIR